MYVLRVRCRTTQRQKSKDTAAGSNTTVAGLKFSFLKEKSSPRPQMSSNKTEGKRLVGNPC